MRSEGEGGGGRGEGATPRTKPGTVRERGFQRGGRATISAPTIWGCARIRFGLPTIPDLTWPVWGGDGGGGGGGGGDGGCGGCGGGGMCGGGPIGCIIGVDVA
jgi:hypothetical protein